MPSTLSVDRYNSGQLLGMLSAKPVRGPLRNARMDHRRGRRCSNWNESNFCISGEQMHGIDVSTNAGTINYIGRAVP